MLYFIPPAYVFSFFLGSICIHDSVVGIFMAIIMAFIPALSVLWMTYDVHNMMLEAVYGAERWRDEVTPEDAQENNTTSEQNPTVQCDDRNSSSAGTLDISASRLDDIDFHTLFNRYDLDESGMIDSREELTQLTMAVIYKLKLDEASYGGNLVQAVDLKVNLAFQAASKKGLIWSERQAKAWLITEFLSESDMLTKP